MTNLSRDRMIREFSRNESSRGSSYSKLAGTSVPRLPRLASREDVSQQSEMGEIVAIKK